MGSSKYRIVVHAEAGSEFERIPFPARRSLNHKVVSLQRNPRPEGCERIGEGDLYRLISAGWAVLYEIEDQSSQGQAGRVQVLAFRPAPQ